MVERWRRKEMATTEAAGRRNGGGGDGDRWNIDGRGRWRR
ncbi:unnamed protein product [Spirodela intermedia]|uniref:Uncharacterized protein n=1 Tax=Spirodela intermedia TaxID=51605 RepID=A0A7I8LLV0_SPIIN|nr:unnamed protein product [Spirodela intermedia]